MKEHFDEFWSVVSAMVDDIRAMPYATLLNGRQMHKLERYAVLHALQKFRIGMTSDDKIKAPKRRDGGAWLAQGHSYPAEYDHKSERECELAAYTVNGGHRTNHTATALNGASELWLREFDTFVWDNPNRFGVGAGYRHYFDGMMQLLWCVEKGIDPSEAGVHSALIESIPDYIDKTGLLVREDGVLRVDIPVMEKAVYGELLQKIDAAACRLREVLGEAFGTFLKGQAVAVPAHLTSVPMDKRYMPATAYIEMAVVIEAYERGLHMKGVDFCCPPVVLVYTEK
ncbi:MAG: hypothetical protein J6R04_00330 [Clostridia bacterium]|nr:hypothetical protein [Clostridia bacterium]